MCICMYIDIPKYNPVSPYNVTCICVFRADLGALYKQLVVLPKRFHCKGDTRISLSLKEQSSEEN